MGKFNPIHTEIIAIVHGKSEYELVTYIRSNLKIKLGIEHEKKGRNSIQINGLMNFINNNELKNKSNFIKKYNDIELGKKKKIKNLCIFPIMDTDDCTESEAENYINKSMFKTHWLYDYIIPIYNINNLEDVLKKAKVPYETKAKGKYVQIFPTNRGQADVKQIEDFCKKIKSASSLSNMHVFIKKCLEIQKKYPTF